MRGLIREVKELIADNPEPEVLDSGLLAIAQKIEHYEIACSGTLKTWAEELGIPRVASLLGSILEDALVLAQKLTALAIHRVNRQAVVGKVPVEPDGVEPESAPVTTREENLQQGKDADESGEKVP
jgi:ferritin-like metal-binding protein YciE